MKFITAVFFAVFLLMNTGLRAQDRDSSEFAYIKNPELPAFTILLQDSSTYFYTKDLKKNLYTILIFFNPDCEHCQRETEMMLDSIDRFKDVQIVMATTQSFDEMKDFIEKYKLNDHKDLITVGWDKMFFFPIYYKMNSVPFIALYDKKQKFVKAFEGDVPVDYILTGIKN